MRNLARAPLSLFLTGFADVWSGIRDGRERRGSVPGLVLMVVSAASFAAMAAVAKKLLPRAPIQSVVLSRGVLMTALFVVLARRRGAPILGSRPGLLLVRGLLGYAALSCYFYSVQQLPLGDAVLLQYSHPIFVAAAAPFLLGEKADRGTWGLVATALVGVALIVQPSGGFRPAALVGLLGSMLSGLAYVTVRDLSRTESPLTILVWFPMATIPVSAIATLAAGREALPIDALEIAGHLLVFGTALLGQVALTLGLARAGAAEATAVTLTGPVFGLAFGYLLFGSIPTAASIAGAVLVLGSLTRLGLRKTGS